MGPLWTRPARNSQGTLKDYKDALYYIGWDMLFNNFIGKKIAFFTICASLFEFPPQHESTFV